MSPVASLLMSRASLGGKRVRRGRQQAARGAHWIAVLAGAMALAACSTLERLNPFAASPKVKMAELQAFTPSASLAARP